MKEDALIIVLDKGLFFVKNTNVEQSPTRMDLLSAIRISIWFQCIIGVSPIYVTKTRVVASKAALIPGLLLFIYNLVSTYISYTTHQEQKAGELFFETNFTAGSVLVLTMILGGTCQTLAYFFTFIISMFYRHSSVQFYNKLLEIGKKMHQVGIQTDFQKIYRDQLMVIIFIIFYHIGQTAFSLLVIWKTFDTYHMAVTFTLVYVSNALSAKDFMMVCQLVTQHFRCLQKVLKVAKLEQDEFPHRLETFYTIHSELCDCFDLITENFGAREMLNILSDFIFITSQAFFAFWSANSGQYAFILFNILIVLLPRCVKVFYVMYRGEELIRTAHMTSKMLEKLDGPFKRAEFHDLAHNFALQVLHLQDLDITAKNFFSLRLTFLFTLVSACVMYFIVLIQFRLREM